MEKNKKFSILKLIRNIILILLILYFLTIIYKAFIMSYISFKIGKIKDSNNYMYLCNAYFDITSIDIENDEIIHKPSFTESNIQFKNDISSECSITNYHKVVNSWYYTNPENKASYTDCYDFNEAQGLTSIEDLTHDYNYEEGFSYESSSPYELVNKNLKKFYNISFLLNPTKIIKIDFNYNDFIFEDNDGLSTNGNETYEKILIYINTYNGLLNKEEHYNNHNKLEYSKIYTGYQFDTLEDSLELSDEMKETIINNSSKDTN